MKKFGKIIGLTCLATLFAVSLALAGWCDPPTPPAPVVGTADGSAFVNTEIGADQLVYNQVNTEHGLMVNNTKTLDVTSSGYNAFHNGPADDGKGFQSSEFGVKASDTFKVACYSVDVTSQGMSQAMNTAGNAGAGASASGPAYASASAGGVNAGVQGQVTTYNIDGMHGGGAQLMGTASYVNVNTGAGLN